MEVMLNMPTMRTNNQHQSFVPLVSSTVDYFLTDHVDNDGTFTATKHTEL